MEIPWSANRHACKSNAGRVRGHHVSRMRDSGCISSESKPVISGLIVEGLEEIRGARPNEPSAITFYRPDAQRGAAKHAARRFLTGPTTTAMGGAA